MGSYIFETQRVSGITRGLSGAAGAGNRPTIGLSEIGPVARYHDASPGGWGGNLANWKPEISRVCTAATVEGWLSCNAGCSVSNSTGAINSGSSLRGALTRLLTRCARISSDGYGTSRAIACSGVSERHVLRETCRRLSRTRQPR